MKTRTLNILGGFLAISGISLIMPWSLGSASAEVVADTGFESGNLSDWNIGSQSGSLAGGLITGNGSGVTLISGSVTFNAGSHGAVGNPTLGDGSPNPYYQPAVDPTSWSFSPYGSYAVALQPNSSQTFDDALTALGVSSSDETDMRSELSNQASASGYGSGSPTDASWITKTVTLQAGTTYTMSWNYIGTDYVPFNDGSITSLTPTSGSPTVSVNNSGNQYALLGFTNPGTGDYSTGTFGSTGWQMSTYTVSVTGDYLLGFAVFNLDDTALSPVLLVDSQPGSTTKNGEDFGAVAPNNSDAPTVPPATTEPPVTDPPATDPVATDPPSTDPEATDPPSTDPTDPPSTDPVETDPPATEPAPTEAPTTTVAEDDDDNRETTVPVETTTTAPETTTTALPESPTTSSIPVLTPDLPKTGNGTETQVLLAIGLMALGFCLILSAQPATRRK